MMMIIPKPLRIKVNVTRMIIYSFIPILSIYAGWRIEKFWLIFGITLAVGLVLVIPVEMILPEPFGNIVMISVGVIITIFVVRYFAKQYNKEIENQNY